MQSLQEFLLRTKGQEYLIAVAFMILFIVVWKLLNPKRKKGDLQGK